MDGRQRLATTRPAFPLLEFFAVIIRSKVTAKGLAAIGRTCRQLTLCHLATNKIETDLWRPFDEVLFPQIRDFRVDSISFDIDDDARIIETLLRHLPLLSTVQADLDSEYDDDVYHDPDVQSDFWADFFEARGDRESYDTFHVMVSVSCIVEARI